MDVDEATVSQLVELGLTQYEARGYLALIGRGDATPAEIARLGRIPRPRSYDVLASLAERGFVATVPGGAGLRYRAKPPDQVFDSLLAVRRQELDRLTARATKLATDLQPRFLQGQHRGEPLDYVEVLRDPAHAVQRISQLWAKSGARGPGDRLPALPGATGTGGPGPTVGDRHPRHLRTLSSTIPDGARGPDVRPPR